MEPEHMQCLERAYNNRFNFWRLTAKLVGVMDQSKLQKVMSIVRKAKAHRTGENLQCRCFN